MQSQVDNSEPPLFFRSRRKNEVVQPADHSIDEFDNADLDLNYILESIEAFNSRILTLEKIQTSDIQQYSPVYSEDAKFYNWLRVSYRDRLYRKNFFKQSYIIGEPCWDMILDLCISEIEGRKISVTSACLASGVPITTALRWISLLERDGVIEKESDSKDRRRTFLRISKAGFESTFRYFKSISMRGK